MTPLERYPHEVEEQFDQDYDCVAETTIPRLLAIVRRLRKGMQLVPINTFCSCDCCATLRSCDRIAEGEGG